MSTTTEREFLGEGVTTADETSPDTRQGRADVQQEQVKHDHAHEHHHEGAESDPLCTGHGCVQTPPNP
ncbi:hypothetical protein AB0I60_20980 [Actinosynnema sp. NPDC050436]|uniref:hypothetical protein n=1 Tax=Actinosynnema sp. NPDC050436 TaxID=3155659 RepID=UPI0033E8A5B5